MITRTVCFIENHMTRPVSVTPKLPKITASVSKPEKECITTNQISRFNEKP